MNERRFSGAVIIGDISPQVAASPETRAKVRLWFAKTIKSRLALDSKNTIFIQSRLHCADKPTTNHETNP